MKTDTSTNLMLVIFCLALVAFIAFSSKVNSNIKKAQQAMKEQVK